MLREADGQDYLPINMDEVGRTVFLYVFLCIILAAVATVTICLESPQVFNVSAASCLKRLALSSSLHMFSFFQDALVHQGLAQTTCLRTQDHVST